MRHWLLAATVALTTPALAASDTDRESRLAGEMALNLFDGEVVELEGADHFYDTLYYEHQIELYTSMIDFLQNDCGTMSLPMQARVEGEG